MAALGGCVGVSEGVHLQRRTRLRVIHSRRCSGGDGGSGAGGRCCAAALLPLWLGRAGIRAGPGWAVARGGWTRWPGWMLQFWRTQAKQPVGARSVIGSGGGGAPAGGCAPGRETCCPAPTVRQPAPNWVWAPPREGILAGPEGVRGSLVEREAERE